MLERSLLFSTFFLVFYLAYPISAKSSDNYPVYYALGQNNIYILQNTNLTGQGNYDLYLSSYNTNGNFLWGLSIGGEQFETCRSIILDSLENIFLIGNTQSYGLGDLDVIVSKIDSSGTVKWISSYGLPSNEMAGGGIINRDGNLLIYGETYSSGDPKGDIMLLEITPEGVILNSMVYNEAGEQVLKSGLINSEGDYVFCGYNSNADFGGKDVLSLRVYPDLKLGWMSIFGGPEDDVAESVISLEDGGLLFGGYSNSGPLGGEDQYLLKTDSWLGIEWSKYQGTKTNQRINKLSNGPDSSIYISGSSQSLVGDGMNVNMGLFDSNGDKKWLSERKTTDDSHFSNFLVNESIFTVFEAVFNSNQATWSPESSILNGQEDCKWDSSAFSFTDGPLDGLDIFPTEDSLPFEFSYHNNDYSITTELIPFHQCKSSSVDVTEQPLNPSSTVSQVSISQTAESLIVELNSSKDQMMELSLISLNGKTVYNEKIIPPSKKVRKTISTSSIVRGIYLLKIKRKSTFQYKKVLLN